jgi:hypothetical protein
MDELSLIKLVVGGLYLIVDTIIILYSVLSTFMHRKYIMSIVQALLMCRMPLAN